MLPRMLPRACRPPWITGHVLVVDGGYSTHGGNSGFGSRVDSTTDV